MVFPYSMKFTVTLCLFDENLFCKVRDSLDMSLCTCSILNLCCISIDRYYAVCHPLKYRSAANNNTTLIMILLIWGVSVIIGGAGVLTRSSQGVCEEACLADFTLAQTMSSVFSFYFPAIVMLCIYFEVFLVAQRQVQNIKNTSTAISKIEKKATKTLAIVMGAFLFCMLPVFFASFSIL